jgi:hypothetical protein
MLLLLAALLQQAPDDVRVRTVVDLGPQNDHHPVRVAAHPGTGLLVVLYSSADLWEVDPERNTKRLVLAGKGYLRPGSPSFFQPLGLHLDSAGRAYVVVNERHSNERPQRAHVVVYRLDSIPGAATPLVEFDHPWGIGPFNHGACHLATGPDGKIYLGVGSRTDHGEKGKDETLDKNGETDLTACMLRFDPAAERPKPEVFCRGLRNPFGFDWDDRGRLVAGEHGPDANHPEELNWLREGRHYGFPYRFGNDERPMYADAVPAPAGLAFEKPIPNLGPDARPGAEPCHTFHPHSAPTGMLFYRKGALPARYEGTFLLTRFGNFLGKEPVGFEVLSIRLEEKDGALAARCGTLVSQLRRPIDVALLKGRLYVLEYTSYDDRRPSRLLEVSGK